MSTVKARCPWHQVLTVGRNTEDIKAQVVELVDTLL